MSSNPVLGPSEALVAYLQQVRRRVGEIWTAPILSSPQLDQIPDFDQLVTAAENIENASPDTSAYVASVVMALLGRAASVDNENPPTTTPVFPADHRLHLSMGAEWYWIGAHFDVVSNRDPAAHGRIALLYSIQRQRAVGVTVQDLAGWTDTDAQITSSLCTVTVCMPTGKSYSRRKPNIQWPAAGGSASFSQAGEPFLFQVGTDTLSGTVDVLPVQLSVDDGEMKIALTFTNPTMEAGQAFFLQGGVPAPGVTPLPTPGIYYSWPQLSASGTITVGGATYTVTGGSAWMDHQLMAKALENPISVPPAASPIPFLDDPTPLNGWSWQYFNLQNGDAFTLATFQTGTLNHLPSVNYGYYLTRTADGSSWISSYLVGTMALGEFQTFPVDAGGGPPSQGSGDTVSIPTQWTYLLLSVAPTPLVLLAQTRAWNNDGTFNNANGSIASELPVELIDLSLGVPGGGGVGFGESVGFEPVAQYQARALAYLASIAPTGR